LVKINYREECVVYNILRKYFPGLVEPVPIPKRVIPIPNSIRVEIIDDWTGTTHHILQHIPNITVDFTHKKITGILTKNNYNLLKAMEFNVSAIPEPKREQVISPMNVSLQKDYVLRDFQQKGVGYITEKNGSALLGDDMGLGKTIQTIAYLKSRPDLRPAVIVCPASLKHNWQNEFKKFIEVDAEILSGITPFQITKNIVIINYDILYAWETYLTQINTKYMVLDEAHYVQNKEARWAKCVLRMAENMPVLALTGTPLTHSPKQLYNIIKVVNPKLFPVERAYMLRYQPDDNNSEWVKNPRLKNKREHELHWILKNTCMYRRTKEEVLPELPPKTISVLPIDITNKADYSREERGIINVAKNLDYKTSAVEFESMVNSLKSTAVKGKIKGCFEWIDNFLDESDEKLVVYCWHHDVVDLLCAKYKGIHVQVDGRIDSNKRQGLVDRFSTDNKIRLFICNIKAGGVGLNLTAASNVVFVELGRTPAEHRQAIDRCHRMLQKYSVNAYFLIGAGTVEEHILDIMDSRSKTIDAIVDGKETEECNLLKVQYVMKELFNQYKRRCNEKVLQTHRPENANLQQLPVGIKRLEKSNRGRTRTL
jgi:SWI/SNF-related matrix-associated actin-dependent regulator 1 of chromatin subfamily A